MLPCSESTAAKVRRNAHSGDADELVVSQSYADALIRPRSAATAFVQFSGDKWPSVGGRCSPTSDILATRSGRRSNERRLHYTQP